MLDKLSIQARVILATVISFLFFIIFDSFYAPKPVTPAAETTQASSANSAPVTAQASNETTTATATQSNAPVTSESTTVLTTVKFNNTVWAIDALGRVANVTLKEAQFLDEAHEGLKLFNEQMTKPLEIRFSDAAVNDEAFKKPYTASSAEVDATTASKTLVLTQKLTDLTVSKSFTFYPDGHYDLRVNLSKPVEYFITHGFRPSVEVDMMSVHGMMIKQFDDTIEIIEDGDATGYESYRDAKIISSFDRYYATFFYNNSFDIWVNKVGDDEPLGFVKGAPEFEFSGYIGPKYVNVLEGIDPELIDVVEYGIFTFMAAPLFTFLDFLHGFTGNWGWSIVILTIVVRLILFPLSAKGMISMHKLKELAPKIKELQRKYKGDPQKLQSHMMDLYKKHGANPLGGCLPFLLQIPVFFAIYRVLVNAIELKGAEWFYITDLSLMDPYYIMPILMGVSMYFQQKITPSNFTDPMQEKVFRFLPLIFTFFFLTFPAGLVLYWFVNNLLSILQQFIINKRLETAKVERHEKD